MHRIVALLLLLAASLPAGAEIYKWTDAQGRVHFGDSVAGTGKPAEAIDTPRPGNTYGNDPESRERSERQRRLNQALRLEEAERENAAAENAQARADHEARCQRLRRSLQTMDGRRVLVTGPDGERRFLDDAQRHTYVDNANRQLAENCK